MPWGGVDGDEARDHADMLRDRHPGRYHLPSPCLSSSSQPPRVRPHVLKARSAILRKLGTYALLYLPKIDRYTS